MKDWIEKLHGFLTINEREIPNHAGSVSHEEALQKAEEEYDVFHKRKNMKFVESDFNKEARKLLERKKDDKN